MSSEQPNRLEAARSLASTLDAERDALDDYIREQDAEWRRRRRDLLQAAHLAGVQKIRPLILQEFPDLGDDLDPLNGVESFRTFEEALKGMASPDSVAHCDHRLVLDVTKDGFAVRALWEYQYSQSSWTDAIRKLRDRASSFHKSHGDRHMMDRVHKACVRFLTAHGKSDV